MDVLTLTCWVREDIKTENVFGLQEAIKDKTQSKVAAHALALYNPKDPVSRPYEDHLRKLILSKDGKLLEGYQELSEVFSEPPSKYNIHVIVDAPKIVCWLRGVTLDSRFEVESSQLETIYDLKKAIKNKNPVALRNVDAATLSLFRISGADDELQESFNKKGEPLQGSALAPNFLGAPVLEPLLVVVDVSASGVSPTLGECF
ncbi:hypothetical protein EV363DRAFT_1406769 [Boletus edulis]|nr:hypothetical protein EV363DRAFT_1406769 [Boletus edulis]